MAVVGRSGPGVRAVASEGPLLLAQKAAPAKPRPPKHQHRPPTGLLCPVTSGDEDDGCDDWTLGSDDDDTLDDDNIDDYSETGA
jgi:hypothetical protein